MGVCSYMGAEGVSVGGGRGWHLLISLMSKVECAVVLKVSINQIEQSPLGLGQPP